MKIIVDVNLTDLGKVTDPDTIADIVLNILCKDEEFDDLIQSFDSTEVARDQD